MQSYELIENIFNECKNINIYENNNIRSKLKMLEHIMTKIKLNRDY